MKSIDLVVLLALAVIPASGCRPAAQAANMEAIKQRIEHAAHPETAAEALAMLRDGNARFVAGQSVHPHESTDYRASLAHEQHPFVTVLGCSDSRVTPVLIFDQGVGDMFVIRVAGNVVDEDVAGSIEYAVDHLGTPLVVVMGHENCGAVTAALHARSGHLHEPHEIEALLSHINPAIKSIDEHLPESRQIAAGVKANVRRSVAELKDISDLRKAVDEGKTIIVGAVYDLDTGVVTFLEDAE